MMSLVEIKKRNDTFDIIKGICILLMIVGHSPVSTLGTLIYSFHMPIFFFIAGYFFKQKKWAEVAIIGTRRLLVPFLCVYIFCFFAAHIIESLGMFSKIVISYIDYKNPTKSFLMIKNCLPVWFLVSLFWCRILFVPIRKIKNDFIILVCIIIGAILSINLYNYFKMPLMFFPSIAALGFFASGHLLAKQNIFSNKQTWWITPYLLAFWATCLSTGKPLVVGRCEYNGFYILDLLGTLGVFITLYIVVNTCNSKTRVRDFLRWCGVNSLIILCVHSIELNFVDFNAFKRSFYPIIPSSYQLYLALILRLLFNLAITYALTKSYFIKRYIFSQYD